MGTSAARSNWLQRYLGVEKVADKQVYDALVQATKDIDASMAKLVKKPGKGAATRRLQMALAHKEIRATMRDLYGNKMAKIIRSGHSNAAAAAVEATLKDEAKLLKKIFPNGRDAREYAKSLRLSARRDIDATMTRVLQSNMTLSQRVWKSHALSQGLVDRAINGALARGDSYEDLAKAVHHLVDPNTPGGVTYAAKRLARTEINNAYHAQSIRDAQEMPWVTAMLWNLSQRHMNDPGDPCEDYARQGQFPIEQVPNKPHPHCRCFVTPEPVSDDTFDRMLDSGQLNNYLDDFIKGGVDGPTAPMPVASAPPLTPRQLREQEIALMKAADKDVSWTGPRVVGPADDSLHNSMIDDYWQSNAFDAVKFDIRDGVRDVQRNGYDGVLPDIKPKDMRKYYSSREGRMTMGREIAARAAVAEPTTSVLWRGMTMSQKGLEQLQQGRSFSIEASSFTKNYDTAVKFSDATDDARWISVDAVGDIPVLFSLRPGAKVARIVDGPDAEEQVAFGQFDVAEVKYPTSKGKPIEVTLRQTSLIEGDRDSTLKPLEMEPAPPEKPTTKAAQPDGWTGPLVAKAAANKDVRRMTDELFLGGSVYSKFMQAAREGSRIVQVKGYKGGLSSPGKQAILDQDGKDVPDITSAMALDLGREVTARLAYAQPSTTPVFKVVQMRAAELQELSRTDAGRPSVSLPLSTFEKNINEAFRLQDSTSDKDVTVVWEVIKGAKVAELGESRATMGSFQVESITEKSSPTGGKYHVVRLKQTDVREFEADTPRGQAISDFEFYTDTDVKPTAKAPAKKAAPKPSIPRAPEPPSKPKTFHEKVAEAQDVFTVRTLLKDKYPDTRFELYEDDIDLASIKEVAEAVEEQFTRHPILEESLEVIEVWDKDKMGTGLAHVQPSLGYTPDGIPITLMRINKSYAKRYSHNLYSMREMETSQWLVPTAKGVKERPMAKTITHEFGHVLDWATTHFESNDGNRTKLGNHLVTKWFLKEHPEHKGKKPSEVRALMAEELQGWEAAPSRYSVTKPNKFGFHYAELVAESYADVEFNGYNKAKPVSRAVHDWLMAQEANPSAIF